MFDLDSFPFYPTEQKFNKCRKADLQIFAQLFNVQVPSGARKDEYWRILIERLRESVIFTDESATAPTLAPKHIALVQPFRESEVDS